MTTKEKKEMCPQCLSLNTKKTSYGGICFDCGDDWSPIPEVTTKDKYGMLLQCPVCESKNTRNDFDFPDTMRDCDDCGSEWNIDNDIVLNGRDVK